MNNNSGIDHIKSQLFSEGKLFSFGGRANGLQFFIITLLTLPIFLLMFEFGLYSLMEAIIKNSFDGELVIFFVLFLPGCISGYIFFAAARRRLRDLNMDIYPYINYLILLNVVSSILYVSVIFLENWSREGAPEQLATPSAIMIIGTIFIDVIVLLIMFFIKGVSNVNQE